MNLEQQEQRDFTSLHVPCVEPFLRYWKSWERLVATFGRYFTYDSHVCILPLTNFSITQQEQSFAFVPGSQILTQTANELAFQDLKERQQWDFSKPSNPYYQNSVGIIRLCRKNTRWRKLRGWTLIATSSAPEGGYSREFWIGVCCEGSWTLTLFKDWESDLNWYPF